MKKLNSLYRNKRALIAPRMKTYHPRDTHNLFTWTLYKFLSFLDSKSFGLKSCTMNREDSFDVVMSMYMGEELYKNNFFKTIGKSKPILEFHWDALSGGFMLERLTVNGKTESVLRKTGDFSYEERREILGYQLCSQPNLDEPTQIE